jgi:hypothetical protein
MNKRHGPTLLRSLNDLLLNVPSELAAGSSIADVWARLPEGEIGRRERQLYGHHHGVELGPACERVRR